VFHPRRVLFERQALDYDIGRRLWERFVAGTPEVRVIASHNRVTGLPEDTPAEAYREAKRTLVVGVRRSLDFAPCRPSAHYQLPLVTSCPGLCEYCYLQTTLGRRPYVRVYVNVDEILARAGELVAGATDSGGGGPVLFEGAAVGDPVPVEPLTGSLAQTVRFFAGLPNAGFRFVSKFPDVDGLLSLEHGGRTRVRVTLNTPRVIREHDHGTPGLEVRLDTLGRLAAAGYPVGAMIAPVFFDGDWRDDYGALFRRLSETLPVGADLTVEVVTHRFTVAARRLIRERHPDTNLPLEEAGRRLKRGQFGYFKYVYPPERLAEAEDLFSSLTHRLLPGATFDYIV
jgi:spore photoproduct lyase